jgi:TPR repeat protein
MGSLAAPLRDLCPFKWISCSANIVQQGYVVSREPHLGQFVLRVELHRSCGFEADGELSQQGAIVRLLVITALAVLSGSGVALLGDDRAAAGTPYELIRTAVGDPQDSADALRRDAERGDPEAEYKLGLAYDVGVGAPQDLEQAAAWYARAAEHGHGAAQYSLGVMYANGRGVQQDLVQAHRWLNLAAAASQPGARSERDLVAKKMTRQQIAEAVRQARGWEPKTTASETPQQPAGTDEHHRPP